VTGENSMSQEYEIEDLIAIHSRRLHKLREMQAIKGVDVDPSVPIEIENIEKNIAELKEELKQLENEKGDASAQSSLEDDQNQGCYGQLGRFKFVVLIATVVILLGLGYLVIRENIAPQLETG
jgi:hypothetical protein